VRRLLALARGMTRLMACRGCGTLVAPGPRCSACRRAQASMYDRTRPEHHALYRTAEWRRLSAEVRASATRCHWCLKPTRRLVADHVIPLDQRPDLALDRANLTAACIPCNTRRGRNAKLPDLEQPRLNDPVRAQEAGAVTPGRRPPAGRPTPPTRSSRSSTARAPRTPGVATSAISSIGTQR
jgi:5-methylcytosine-specific restriction endonuclease McrA